MIIVSLSFQFDLYLSHSNIFTFQLKEKKEKLEKEQAKKKDDFKSGRIVGKVWINNVLVILDPADVP